MQVVTVATPASLARARVLGSSLQRHQPDWPYEVVLVAGDDVVSAADHEGPLQVRSVSERLDLDIAALLAQHGEEDLSALLMPHLLARYAERAREPAPHLPSSVWVLAALQPIESALAARSVLLVPRMTADVPTTGSNPHAHRWNERAGSRRR